MAYDYAQNHQIHLHLWAEKDKNTSRLLGGAKKKYTAFMDYNRMICEIARVEKKKTELNCKMREGANGGRF